MSLLDVLGEVVDPRARRGVRYSAGAMSAAALAAVVAGARSLTAIGQWVGEAPASVLSQLGFEGSAPTESTIRRFLQALDPDALDKAIGEWMWRRTAPARGRRVVSFDGKSLRGTREGDGRSTHLLSGVCQQLGVILGQIGVDTKTNEIPMLRELLAGIDIDGMIVTADAMHTNRDTATYITDLGGYYLLTVKDNQPSLRKALKRLPWHSIRTHDRARTRGHGRHETRTLKALEIVGGASTGVEFPGARLALKITRPRVDTRTRKFQSATVYAITSLSAAEATPRQIAAWLRGHWHIENRVHCVRDVTFDEDRCRVRTGAGAQVMATLRNTTIGLLRLRGHHSIASGLRYHSYQHERPLELLKSC
ncbi:ISAs1 family transposase [Nocardia lijiangensis]|uniref:ISAs1 family transposase n=1 Tax=Nocardia lijiangensis TaxID=299618 RepID=UPI000835BFB3|nr:ISAs1 family transposase [Nocardia lijiangensis]